MRIMHIVNIICKWCYKRTNMASRVHSTTRSLRRGFDPINRQMSIHAMNESIGEEQLATSDYFDPKGNLFSAEVGTSLVGKYAEIIRVIGPQSSAQALLATGGPNLARFSSFDPGFDRAKNWISSHAVGPAVGSPIVASGLFCGLVEASFPKSVLIANEMKQVRPILVGIEMKARIVVNSVEPTNEFFHLDYGLGDSSNNAGYEVSLTTELSTVRDKKKIVEGTYRVYLPDYMKM